ncbi:hypothetical protein PR202_gb04677 [Eleusine coracana subsp. coracana]|uniref:Uncharacterized protein n=1 Tax=Eleusine coracana subsp. coracana TaxID=191504 RepID=A0AAV5E4F0_ELECO|nr:hypothetical protein PR202_gb04677 [Eleusine coracana subsp. coracana]
MRAQAWTARTVARLMTPFNCRAAHASLPHLLPRYRYPPSSYSLLLLSVRRRHLASSSASPVCSASSVLTEMLRGNVLHGASAPADRAVPNALMNILLSIQIGQNGIKDSSSEGINGTSFLCGARIGIVAKPSPEFVAGVFGTWLSGGVAVPLALSYPEAELLHVMNDSDISMILSTKEHHDIMDGISTKCSAHCTLLPSVASIPTEMNSQESSTNDVTSSVSSLITEINRTNKIKGDDPALILYTSGTTDSLTSNLHVHGLFNALFAPLYSGSMVEFMPKCVRGIWQRWRESYPKDASTSDEAITVFTGVWFSVPTMYTRLLQGYDSMDSDQQCASSYAAKQLRLMMCGSSALPSPLMKRWEEVTGHRLLERYGMTEFVMALSNPLHGVRKAGTVGKPLPRVEAKIIMEDGIETATGVGELCIRSPSLFKEYWRKPEVTAESFVDGGYFKTGDTVTVDEDGYFIILGRTNADIMKVGGYKLSALEIEAVLLEHDVVLECAVLGLPDEAYGEVICAIIVPTEDAKERAEQESKPALTLEALTSWSKDRLAPYKIPTRLYLWDSLPRNAMGKVNKKELKKLLGA